MSAASRRPGRAPASEGRSRMALLGGLGLPELADGPVPAERGDRVAGLGGAPRGGPPGDEPDGAQDGGQDGAGHGDQGRGDAGPCLGGAAVQQGQDPAGAERRDAGAGHGGGDPGGGPGQPRQRGQAPEQGDQRPRHGGVPGRERGPRPDRAAHRALRGCPARMAWSVSYRAYSAPTRLSSTGMPSLSPALIRYFPLPGCRAPGCRRSPARTRR